MASKFQNRLVGTIILVALGVIVLPGLLDGKKKHYEDEFAAIPLVPKPGDSQEIDAVPPVSQPLPIAPPEGVAQAVAVPKDDSTSQAANDAGNLPSEPTIVAPPPVQSKPVEVKPVEKKPAEVKPVPVEKNRRKLNQNLRLNRKYNQKANRSLKKKRQWGRPMSSNWGAGKMRPK